MNHVNFQKLPKGENERVWARISISAVKNKGLQFPSFLGKIPCLFN